MHGILYPALCPSHPVAELVEYPRPDISVPFVPQAGGFVEVKTYDFSAAQGDLFDEV